MSRGELAHLVPVVGGEAAAGVEPGEGVAGVAAVVGHQEAVAVALRTHTELLLPKQPVTPPCNLSLVLISYNKWSHSFFIIQLAANY